MSEALDYAGLSNAQGLSITERHDRLVFTTRVSWLAFIAAKSVWTGDSIGLVKDVLSALWKRQPFVRPFDTQIAIDRSVLIVQRGRDESGMILKPPETFEIPIDQVLEIRKNRFEHGVWIDAPGYIKDTFFKGRKDAQVIADTLNRRLRQLRADAEG